MIGQFCFDNMQRVTEPFPHFVAPEFLDSHVAERLLRWFERDAVWIEKKVQSFYESYDLSLSNSDLPNSLSFLISDDFLANVRDNVGLLMNARLGQRMDVTAHRLVAGQHIKIHSDFGEVRQTHRLLVQLNRGWPFENGGLFMLLANERPDEPSEKDCYYLPEHRTAFCFKISPQSLHAVSQVHRGDRYTLCLSFYGDER